MKHYRNCLILTILSIGACASPSGGDFKYIFPKETPSAKWQGEAGFEYADKNVKIHTGPKKKGEIFYEMNIRNARTAILGEDFTYHIGPIIAGKKLTLKKGSPLYARQFTFTHVKMKTYEFADRYTQGDDKNPIEWCAPAPNNKGAVCLYWQDSNKVYVESSTSGSPMIPRSRSIPRGDKRPIPRFSESPVDAFPPSLKLTWSISRTSKKSIHLSERLGTYEGEGFLGEELSEEKILFDDDGLATFEHLNGHIQFSRITDSDNNSVTVSVIKTPIVPGHFDNMDGNTHQ
ncbi:MAG: hypothetical protein ACSHXY_09645 [Alphaproteobacteria bacterium]